MMELDAGKIGISKFDETRIKFSHFEINTDVALSYLSFVRMSMDVQIHLACQDFTDLLIFEGKIQPGLLTPICKQIHLPVALAPYKITIQRGEEPVVMELSSELLRTLDYVDSVCKRASFADLMLILEYEISKENKFVCLDDELPPQSFPRDGTHEHNSMMIKLSNPALDEECDLDELENDGRFHDKIAPADCCQWLESESYIDRKGLLAVVLDRVIVTRDFNRNLGEIKWFLTFGALDYERGEKIGPFKGEPGEAVVVHECDISFMLVTNCSRYLYIGLVNAETDTLLGHKSIDLQKILTTRANRHFGACTIKEIYSHKKSFEELVQCHFRIYTP